MESGNKGLFVLSAVLVTAVLFLAGCAEEDQGGSRSPSDSGEPQQFQDQPTQDQDQPAQGSESEPVPFVVDLMSFTSGECLDAQSLFAFLDEQAEQLYARTSSYDFDYQSKNRVRRNFALMLAAGTLNYDEREHPEFRDFAGMQQEGCLEIGFASASEESKAFPITDFGKDYIEFANDEKGVEYRIQVLGPNSLNAKYVYSTVDYQCQSESEVQVYYEEMIRVGASPADLPAKESISQDYLNLIQDATLDSGIAALTAERSESGFVEIDAGLFRSLVMSEINAQIFTCTDVPAGGAPIDEAEVPVEEDEVPAEEPEVEPTDPNGENNEPIEDDNGEIDGE